MNVPEALAALGVTGQTVSQAEKDHLDREGYLLLTAEQIAHSAQATDALIASEGAEAGKEVHLEEGTNRLADPAAPQPDQALVLALAGTVIVFNAHTWPGGALHSRRSVNAPASVSAAVPTSPVNQENSL